MERANKISVSIERKRATYTPGFPRRYWEKKSPNDKRITDITKRCLLLRENLLAL